MNENRCLVVMPTYDELANIERIIPEVLKQNDSIDVLVVDDNSPDGTGKLVKEMSDRNHRVFLLMQNGKRGLGVAYQNGYRYALNHGYQYVIGMDADFSHDPCDIPRLLRGVVSADYVVGSRWIREGGLVNWPWHRVVLSWVAGHFIYMLHGTGIHDSTSGFQCFRRETLEGIQLENMHSSGYSFQLEAKFRAHLAGFRLLEIPIVFKDRTRGVSKIPRRTVLETIFVAIMLRIQGGGIRKRMQTTGNPTH
jgi:dolichol-phosphate mannosyltransferase